MRIDIEKNLYDELREAAYGVIVEIDEWLIPQVDDDGVYGDDTAVGRLTTALHAIDLYEYEGDE